MIRRLGFALMLGMAACGGRPSPAPAVAPAHPALLTLGEMKLIDVKSKATVVFRADGNLQVDGSTKARVTADGKLFATNGEILFELQRDGTIMDVAYGKLLGGAIIEEDGSLSVSSSRFSIADSGELVGRDVAASASVIRIEGATSTGLKRTAMFVFVLLVLGANQPSPK